MKHQVHLALAALLLLSLLVFGACAETRVTTLNGYKNIYEQYHNAPDIPSQELFEKYEKLFFQEDPYLEGVYTKLVTGKNGVWYLIRYAENPSYREEHQILGGAKPFLLSDGKYVLLGCDSEGYLRMCTEAAPDEYHLGLSYGSVHYDQLSDDNILFYQSVGQSMVYHPLEETVVLHQNGEVVKTYESIRLDGNLLGVLQERRYTGSFINMLAFPLTFDGEKINVYNLIPNSTPFMYPLDGVEYEEDHQPTFDEDKRVITIGERQYRLYFDVQNYRWNARLTNQ